MTSATVTEALELVFEENESNNSRALSSLIFCVLFKEISGRVVVLLFFSSASEMTLTVLGVGFKSFLDDPSIGISDDEGQDSVGLTIFSGLNPRGERGLRKKLNKR
nr:hypothetical protein Iba_chr14aCG10530 [Ipomoea batatas]